MQVQKRAGRGTLWPSILTSFGGYFWDTTLALFIHPPQHCLLAPPFQRTTLASTTNRFSLAFFLFFHLFIGIISPSNEFSVIGVFWDSSVEEQFDRAPFISVLLSHHYYRGELMEKETFLTGMESRMHAYSLWKEDTPPNQPSLVVDSTPLPTLKNGAAGTKRE